MYILCSRIYALFVPLQKPWKDCSVHTHCLYSTVQTFNHHRNITLAIRHHHSHRGSMAGLYWQLWDVLRFRWVIYLLRSVLEGAACVFRTRIQTFQASQIRIRNNLYGSGSSSWSGSYINKQQNFRKNLDFYSFVTSLKLVISENRCKCTYG